MDALLKVMAREKAGREEKQKTPPRDNISITQHTINAGDEIIRFTATTGYMPMMDDNDKLKCKIFFTSYTRDDVKDKTTRPVTFAFNGGPGASSMWIHFGMLGPKRVLLTEEGDVLRPPAQIVDNEYTWLKFTDLVFIDPVGTGYSRPASEEDAKNFYGVKEDLESVGDFIRLFVTKHARWLSPKFLVGESYGTARASGLSDYLQEHHSMDLNGILLISSVLNFQFLTFTPGNDMPYFLFFPTFCATGWYHGKVKSQGKDIRKFLEKVEKWAVDEYLPALALGDCLSDEKRSGIIRQMSAFTGLSEKFIDNCNLRISGDRFSKELLRDEKRTTGRMDSRFKGIDGDSAGEMAEYDPSFSRSPFVAGVNHYIRQELKYENDLLYMPISMEVNKKWDWSSGLKKKFGMRMGYDDFTDTLRKQMCMNPYLNVFFACGYYDLATPYYQAVYTRNHLGLDRERQDNVTVEFYETGHMIYYHLQSMKKLESDVRRFYEKTLALT